MIELTPKEIVKSLIDSGYTQVQIAKATGIKQSSVSRLFTGVHTNPRLSTIRAIENLYTLNISKQKATPCP